MTDTETLTALKRAFWLWANSKTYEDACKHWRRICELFGYDVATDTRIPPAS